jgi:hypothetical protein
MQTIENDTLSWAEPETARFARLETKAVQRPHFGPWSVSVVRVVPTNPFETTRKKIRRRRGRCRGLRREDGGGASIRTVGTSTICVSVPDGAPTKLPTCPARDKISSEISVAYIWLKNDPSRQVQRETALERVIFGNVPKVQQPLRFESPCGNRGISKPTQG